MFSNFKMKLIITIRIAFAREARRGAFDIGALYQNRSSARLFGGDRFSHICLNSVDVIS